ncbi:MAG TPA: DUF3667 domain-containing protein [Frateuria sp.]|uniref:DUF3667 domain-containing protein n=1 Tax=Frateuria sp. TaxID=2211372 RepID=UPI002D80C240|nr:DUF3667 domain-containing protein [Frateuria sp.]HET6804827.1 DUF3667 domain-containing protein [Frateuria sp.]
MNELTEAGKLYCANCTTPLEGEFCHHCGQSVHSVLKPVHHMLEDGMDMFLHVDGRILHTLPPLLAKPGFLTLEYFAGRRQRYVAPFRVMFVLCLMAFFAAHLAVGERPMVFGDDAVQVDVDAFKQARTPAEVDQALQRELAHLQPVRNLPAVGKMAASDIQEAERKLRKAAAKRRAELGDTSIVLLGPATAGTSGANRPGAAHRPDDPIKLLAQKPVQIRWLPDFINQRLTRAAKRLSDNLDALDSGGERAADAQERLISQLFSALPQTMLLLLPLFALLLKVVYLFRRRLYMEHLIVALHSHAFLFLSLLLVVVLTALKGWLQPHAAWLAQGLGWVRLALLVWMPVYLLLMQKRVYRQGWPMTIFKYLLVGYCYSFLLGMVLAAGFVWTLAH